MNKRLVKRFRLYKCKCGCQTWSVYDRLVGDDRPFITWREAVTDVFGK